MRWDISGKLAAVQTWEDWKQWDHVAACLSPPAALKPRDACHVAQWDALMRSPGQWHPESKDIAQVRALLPMRRESRDDFKKGAGIYPFPVYVATFADGSKQRTSFWTRKGKPLDYANGFNVSMILARSVPIAGHVEHNGLIWEDTHFQPRLASDNPNPRKESPTKRLAAICRALNEGEIEAALLMAKSA